MKHETARMLAAVGFLAVAGDAMAQGVDADLKRLVEALRDMEAASASGVPTPDLEPVRPDPDLPASDGNLHEDGVLMPATPAEVLAYLNTFDPVETRLTTILAEVCEGLMAQATIPNRIQAICRPYVEETS